MPGAATDVAVEIERSVQDILSQAERGQILSKGRMRETVSGLLPETKEAGEEDFVLFQE
jgi:hypothetical protein